MNRGCDNIMIVNLVGKKVRQSRVTRKKIAFSASCLSPAAFRRAQVGDCSSSATMVHKVRYDISTVDVFYLSRPGHELPPSHAASGEDLRSTKCN